MRSVQRVFAIAVLIGGCSNTATNGGRVSNSNNPVTPLGGAGSTGAAPTMGGFGNTQNQPAATMRAAVDAGGVPVGDGSACVVGKFCAPSVADKGCGMITLAATTKMTMMPGNLLIIFDQSQSMQETFSGNTTKLAGATKALVDAITPLAASLTVGAIFLPDPAIACIADNPQTMSAVQPIEGAGNIPFQPGPAFLTAFNAHWSMQGTGMGIGTPLNEAFDRADVALKAAMGTLKGPIAVLVFTDGQPNCTPDPNVTKVPTKSEPAHASDWFVQNVPTYMIGLPGAMDGAQLLNDIASGGSGGASKMYISPADPAALTMKLKELIQLQVSSSFDSCSIDLNPPTSTPDMLQLVVQEASGSTAGMDEAVPRDLGTAGGWTITPDGTHVELVGDVCTSAKNGTFSRLTFTYGCKSLPPPPPGHLG